VIKDLNLSTIGNEGIYLYNTTNSVIKNVSIRNKKIGLYTVYGYNNNFSNNIFCNNLYQDYACYGNPTGFVGTGNRFGIVIPDSCGVSYTFC
jgi:nitrous oxidase accessory protein NosD